MVWEHIPSHACHGQPLAGKIATIAVSTQRGVTVGLTVAEVEAEFACDVLFCVPVFTFVLDCCVWHPTMSNATARNSVVSFMELFLFLLSVWVTEEIAQRFRETLEVPHPT